MENKVVVPAQGKKIALQSGRLNVPESPIIPYIEGDGIGIDVAPVMLKVVNIAVEEAHKDERKISWMEIYTSEKSTQVYGRGVWLPAEALGLIREYRVTIEGPLTAPVGDGIRSLSIALRQGLDLYICLRPICYYQGTPSPARHPELTNMVIFRESSEDIYADIEWKTDSADTEKVIKLLREGMSVEKVHLPEHCGIGTKPCLEEGTERLVYAAIEYVIANDRDSVILVHEGNIMKFTEGVFKNWSYQLAHEELSGELIDGGPWLKVKNPNTGKEIVIKDVIADAFLQQILLRPAGYDAIVCINLDGDYIFDTLAAQVGGIGVAPGADIGDERALFEAIHGTTPKYTRQDKVNPGSIILSAEMVLRHMGWTEAADLIVKDMEGAINTKIVTYDFECLIEGTKLLKCSEFGDVVTKDM